ncbi:MAG: ABC transporter permease [Gemmatimonadales bacterium]
MSLFWRRRRRQAELDEEIQGHLAEAARDHEARGKSPDEAAYVARREFGNATLVKEVTRQMWGGVWLGQLWQDLRLAVRSLRRTPAFALVAVVALGLGLGLSTTMFAVMDNVLHPRSAYANAGRIFQLNVRMSVSAGKLVPPGELYRLVRARVPALDGVTPFNAGRDPIPFGNAERDQLEMIVPSRWFAMVGIRPERGRVFAPADGNNVAVVSHEVWRRALGGPRNLAGVHVTIGDRSYAVVGVLPPMTYGAGAYLPLLPADEDAQPMGGMVRLRAGATPADAMRQLAAVAQILTATFSTPSAPWSLRLMPTLDFNAAPDELHDIHLAMVGSALAVLLIACVNLAHLMLARGTARRRELALRMALGADRLAAVRSMLVEVAMITAGGLALGALLAVWASHVLESLMPYELSWWGAMQTQLSWRVFALGALAAVVSAVFFGLFPAIRVAFGVRITDPLKDEGGTTTGRPSRYSPLVIGEVALALALLMGGALLLRSVHQLRSADTGFDAETLVKANVRTVFRDTVRTIDWEQVLATTRGTPGVAGAALEAWSPTLGAVVTAELDSDTSRMIMMQTFRVVTPSYLDVHGLPILKGRDFEPGDAAGDGVAILSAAAAARLYPRGDAVGRMLKLGAPTAKAPWVRIVGVARTPFEPWGGSSLPGQGGDTPLWVVRPWGKLSNVSALVRAASRDPRTLVQLRRALLRVQGATSVSVQPYTWVRDTNITSFNFLAKVFVAMGAIGLGLAALGLYAVLAYAVSRRMREFGVRIALGAEPRTLFRMVMRDGLVMLLAGTGIGAFGALGAAYLFNAVLIGVYPTDAVSLVVAEAVLLAVGLAATIAPALRAVRANPLDIIRAV